jgi:hypothetical protein
VKFVPILQTTYSGIARDAVVHAAEPKMQVAHLE